MFIKRSTLTNHFTMALCHIPVRMLVGDLVYIATVMGRGVYMYNENIMPSAIFRSTGHLCITAMKLCSFVKKQLISVCFILCILEDEYTDLF